ncbi:hypothetical protein COR51_23840 [Vibrio mediterranei]|uniref:Rap1a immunity protein domain-containing protein n=2 Tax=Vibrio mediterranei TaxID=689 RepID=A0ABX5D914_9VIBR|nr:hypothetical protein COR51_23840 [Vibrio mediterranei]
MRASLLISIMALSIAGSAYSDSSVLLTREQQLRALEIREPGAGVMATLSINYRDRLCGHQSDDDVSRYLSSDYHYQLLALFSLLPTATFQSLHRDSLKAMECDTLQSSSDYIKWALKLSS